MTWSSPTGWNTSGWSCAAAAGGTPGTLTHNPATVDLTNGNLTATANTTAADGAISRSVTTHSSGKYCFSVDYGTSGQSGGQGSGIVNASELNTNYMGETNNSIGFEPSYGGTSNFLQNNASVATIGGGWAAGTVLFFVDLDGKFMCVSNNGGSTWYGTTGSANADPSNGSNCLDLTAIAFPWHAAVDTYSNGKTLTITLIGVSGKPSGSLDWG